MTMKSELLLNSYKIMAYGDSYAAVERDAGVDGKLYYLVWSAWPYGNIQEYFVIPVCYSRDRAYLVIVSFPWVSWRSSPF